MTRAVYQNVDIHIALLHIPHALFANHHVRLSFLFALFVERNVEFRYMYPWKAFDSVESFLYIMEKDFRQIIFSVKLNEWWHATVAKLPQEFHLFFIET